MSLNAFVAPEALQRQSMQPLSKKPRCTIAGVGIDRVDMNEAITVVIDTLRKRTRTTPFLIMGPNAQLITLAQKNELFAEALRASSLNVPDGISVVLASRLLGREISARVPGGELMEHLCHKAADNDLSIFLLGGLPGAAAEAATQLRRRYPTLSVAGTYCPPQGFENDPKESAHIRKLISESSPDLLFVALGAPKQEIWMHQNCFTLPIGAAMSVGAALDTLAGLRRRAPLWTQRLGLEWFYRLIREPRRLWRRYLIGNPYFIYLVLKQLFLYGQQQEQLPAICHCEPGADMPPPLHTTWRTWKTGPQA